MRISAKIFFSYAIIAGVFLIGLSSLDAWASAPELTIAKSNDAPGGAVNLGGSFNWTLTVSNTSAAATFLDGDLILVDDVPPGATFGAPTPGNFNGITNSANIACMIGAGVLTCSADGANVSMDCCTSSFDVVFSVTPTQGGTLTNPEQPGGICRVDPNNEIPEDNEGNNNCNVDSVTVNAEADLSATKSNSASGSVFLGLSFDWTITISNTQTPGAVFSDGQVILRDALPNGATTYGALAVENAVEITGLANLVCEILANVLTCVADGGDVEIGAFTGSFDVRFSVTPGAAGDLTNPSAGVCRVDPDDVIAEGDETNNDCDDEVDVRTYAKLAPPQTISLQRSFGVPFWCGQRKEEFTMDGKTFVNVEQYETEIEVVFPQRRILFFFLAAPETANIIEMATITEPSNFESAGQMTLPIRNRLDSGKTFRASCQDLLTLPTRADGAGEVAEVLGQLVGGLDFFHGVWTFESDKTDVRVFVTKIVRSWKGVDEGGGPDFKPGEQLRTRSEVRPLSIRINRGVSFELEQVVASSAAQALTQARRPVQFQPRMLAGGRGVEFRLTGVEAYSLAVEIFDLNGHEVFADRTSGNRLRWSMRSESGAPLANGVYLTVLTARDLEGRLIRSEIKKLVVLR